MPETPPGPLFLDLFTSSLHETSPCGPACCTHAKESWFSESAHRDAFATPRREGACRLTLPAVDTNAAATLALALGMGAIFTLICARLRTPAILPLLVVGFIAGGIAVGDEHTLIDADGLGDGLLAFITVSVAILIFEGSLHLDRQTLAQAPKAVRGLLTIGAALTWLTAALLARFVLGLEWGVAALLGAILIVTGPTVVQPILRRLPLRPNLHAALMAEGVLIDPIGVVAAAATLEIVRHHQSGMESSGLALALLYAKPMLAGALAGFVLGWIGAAVMRLGERESGGHDSGLHLVGMGVCMLSVGLSEMISAESGLVAAAVCGVVIANSRIVGAEDLRRFKEQVSVLLVGALFILLASRFGLSQFATIGWREVAFLAGLILVSRPICIFASTFRSVLTVREKLFCCFLAPRGIVAASFASIAAIELAGTKLGAAGEQIETVVIMVIVVTVAMAGVLGAPVARLLGVTAGKPNGVIIVGGHRFGLHLARELKALSIPVTIIDTNTGNIAAARALGIETIRGDATDGRWLEDEVISAQTGWVVALTDNADVDTVIARWGRRRFGPNRALRWYRDKPTQGQSKAIYHWGRPLRHLLFQMDMEMARIETWTGEAPEGAVPVAIVDEKGNLTLVEPEEAESKADPESRVVGVVVGPAPKKRAESERDAPSDEADSEDARA
jgi:NhaP-type Na+/H+ or K+/H+ antiporter